VDKQYELYCVADSLFYDSPARFKDGRGDFDLVSQPLPRGWDQFTKGEWIVCVSPTGRAPSASPMAPPVCGAEPGRDVRLFSAYTAVWVLSSQILWGGVS
jgi:hypothetical protein